MKEPADKETLRCALDIEWRDHFQTRRQTWKTLEIPLVLLIGFVFLDRTVNEAWVRWVLGVPLMYTFLSGVVVSLHHRKAQIRKFTHIDRLEDALGLHQKGLLDEVHPPRAFRWHDILHPLRMNTPLFITRMHLMLLLFFVIYFVSRLIHV